MALTSLDLDRLFHHSTGTMQTLQSFVKWIRAKKLDSMMPSVMLLDACGQVTAMPGLVSSSSSSSNHIDSRGWIRQPGFIVDVERCTIADLLCPSAA